MNLRTPLLTALLCLPLMACGERPQANSAGADTTLGQKVREATNDARKELAESNISISGTGDTKVEISPKGDLLINSTPVVLNDSQRALALQYRQQVLSVAEAGIEVGIQGANLGARAAGEALKGIFSGDAEKIEARINAEAAKLEASASKICDQLPAMLATQQQLAAAIPEFKPYAKMDQSDITDCRDGHVTVR
ncbi:MAG: DUF2884 family protein [Stenotrophomonas sp.]|uniref:DUF2884 family protein n=1 Tax=Stenotrophomonas sp. TaxID=69392 RepID=UPI003D6CB261